MVKVSEGCVKCALILIPVKKRDTRKGREVTVKGKR